jgi:hypothetical protein
LSKKKQGLNTVECKPVRDNKGRLVAGNTEARKTRKEGPQLLKSYVKEEIIACAHSLTIPTKELIEKGESEESNSLIFLTAHAIKHRHYKWIQWLIEMAVGRPKPFSDEDDVKEIDDKLANISTGELTQFIKKVASDAS